MDEMESKHSYRAPEPNNPEQEKFYEVREGYFEDVRDAVEDEIGWIVGDVPQYPIENIKYQQNSGGSYQEGIIQMSDNNFNYNYPHEYLHWLSKHRDKVTDYGFTTEKITTVGSKVNHGPTKQRSLTWLSDAIISETTQRVLWKSGELPEPETSYKDEQGGINRYVSGWENTRSRRYGDFYDSPDYSDHYGTPFRALTKAIGEYIHTDEGQEIYQQIKSKFDPEGNRLQDISDLESEDQSYETAFRLLQIGEFSLANGPIYGLIDKTLGRGKLKELVDQSIDYERELNFLRLKHAKANQDKVRELRKSITNLVSPK